MANSLLHGHGDVFIDMVVVTDVGTEKRIKVHHELLIRAVGIL